jgi:hypothetical protein
LRDLEVVRGLVCGEDGVVLQLLGIATAEVTLKREATAIAAERSIMIVVF